MFTSLSEAFQYIEDFTNFERDTSQLREYRLDRMDALYAAFDHPELAIKTIHIAGSKGKGTTAVFIASVLKENGFKTGLYSSPHVLTYKERISEAGTFFPDELYISEINKIHDYLNSDEYATNNKHEKPTTFELLTLLAFLVYRSAGCEWAVIETGLGGRLDATNLVIPELSIITSIELEHTHILGNTIAEIAGEKAGIIKEGVPVLITGTNKEAAEVLKRFAKEKNAPIIFLSDKLEYKLKPKKSFFAKIQIKWGQSRLSFLSGISNPFTPVNAGAALAACSILNLGIDLSTIKTGLKKTKLKARNEIWKLDRTYIFDGAHTASSLNSIISTVNIAYKKKGTVIFALALDKDPKKLAKELLPWTETLVITSPGFFKKSDPDAVYKACKQIGFLKIHLFIEPVKALEFVKAKTKGPVLVTGSFFLVSEIQKEMYGDFEEKE